MKRIFLLCALLALPTYLFCQMSSETLEATAKLKIRKYVLPNAESAFSSVSYVSANDVNAIPKERTFSPPVQKYDPDFAKMEILSDEDFLLELPVSYSVSIQKGDLVDKNGNEVSGSYTLYFRDLSTPAAMALSGVSMKYDSGGVINQFQSAGMFEIYAMQGDQELFVKDGEQLDITMPTIDTDAGYNLYVYNEDIGQWDYQNALTQPARRPKPDSVSVYSDAYKLMYLLNWQGDENTFQQRWASLEYARTYKLKEGNKYKSGLNRYGTLSFTYFKMKRIYVKKHKHNVFFKLPVISKRTKSSIFYKNYPELRYFRNTLWKYQGPLDKYGFYNRYCKKRRYYDLRINYDYLSGYFTIKLKDANGFEEFQAFPYHGNIELTARDKHVNEAFFKRYSKTLKHLENKFDEKIAFANKEKNDTNLAFVRNRMSKQELAMSMDEWKEYAKKANDYFLALSYYNNEISLTRSISIQGFGLVNCDRIYRMENPTQLMAQFYLPNGKLASDGKIILICGGDNSCFTEEMDGNWISLTLEANSVNTIAFISRDENMFLVRASDIASALVSNGMKKFYAYTIDSEDASDAIYQALQM